MEMTPGYGEDHYCKTAAEKIKNEINMPSADVHFLVGGTQTNMLFISSVLRPHQGVMCAVTGHINAHETGAVEATGHKVIALPSDDGTLSADVIRETLVSHYADVTREHIVQPAMVYVSFPTENGTLYSKAQLTAVSELCRERDIPLYLDGARLGYGLMCSENDLTIEDIASLCDAFYIGGTKVGALCGEAVVFTGKKIPPHFMTIVKQHGALMAKGRLLGIQFDTLFTDDLYFNISRHAIEMAEKLKHIFRDKGYTFFLETPTNQQFILLENPKMAELRQKVGFDFWEKADDTHTVVRFATAWSTSEADLESLAAIL
jgi:threonine aldolase